MNTSLVNWVKLLAALALLVCASVFHANASGKASQQSNPPDVGFNLQIPAGWEQQKNLMGNKLVATKRSMNGGSGSDALLMVTDMGLNQSKVPSLGTAMKKKISQICFHAESCRWDETEMVKAPIGTSLLQKLVVTEMGHDAIYWVLIAQTGENQFWSATLRAPIGMSKVQEAEFKMVLINVFAKNEDPKKQTKHR